MKYNFLIDDKIIELHIYEIINFIKKNTNKIIYKIINDEKIKVNNTLVLNTQFICHRINKIDEIKNINNVFGLEFDVRVNSNEEVII